jgi:xanthosine utilization system XapX-like protein
MTTEQKTKDDEKVIWLIVGGIFSLLVIAMDLFYSSYDQMGDAFKWIVRVLHAGLIVAWITSLVKFSDPNYEPVRKIVVALCVVLGLMVGIHHATSVEDNQVIIDSQENANKP